MIGLMIRRLLWSLGRGVLAGGALRGAGLFGASRGLGRMGRRGPRLGRSVSLFATVWVARGLYRMVARGIGRSSGRPV